MRTVVLTEFQTARLFPTERAAMAYVQAYVPDVAQPEIVRVVKLGFGSAYGFIMYADSTGAFKHLFGIGPDESGGAK